MPMFHRITLMATEAPRLLWLLRKLNVHAGTLKPGYEGAALALLEHSALLKLPGYGGE